MTELKIGDRVKCIDAYGTPFKQGAVYRVVGGPRRPFNGDEFVDVRRGGKCFDGWLTERFVKVRRHRRYVPGDTVLITGKTNRDSGYVGWVENMDSTIGTEAKIRWVDPKCVKLSNGWLYDKSWIRIVDEA